MQPDTRISESISSKIILEVLEMTTQIIAKPQLNAALVYRAYSAGVRTVSQLAAYLRGER